MFKDNLKHWNLKKIITHVLLEISYGGILYGGILKRGDFVWGGGGCPGGILSIGILS